MGGRGVRAGRGTESGAGRLWLAGTAVDALLDVRAERFQLGGPELLAILQGPAPATDYLAGAGVAALLDLVLVELLGMFPDDVARRHGYLPVAGPLGYQRLIVAADAFRPGTTLLAEMRSSSVNYLLLMMASNLLAR